MSIVYVRRKLGASTETGEKGLQSFRTEYIVKSDVARESRSAILNCGQLPVYGSPHPENAAALCVKVNPVQNKDNPYLWDVACEWNQTTGKRDPREDQKQPDERRPQWSYNFTPIPQYLFVDLDNKPFVDTAGTIISPPPEIPIYVDEITVSRYEATLDRAGDRAYLNATNLDTWQDLLPNEALITDIDTQEVFEQGAYWFLRKFTILANPTVLVGQEYMGGWNPKQLLNAGPRMLVVDPKDPAKKIPVAVKVGNYVDGQPWPLDEDGIPIPLEAGEFTKPLVWLKFRTVKTALYAALNLVPPWE